MNKKQQQELKERLEAAFNRNHRNAEWLQSNIEYWQKHAASVNGKAAKAHALNVIDIYNSFKAK